GRPSVLQDSQRRNSSRIRGSPRGGARGGGDTRSVKRGRGGSGGRGGGGASARARKGARVCSSSCSRTLSLDWKWANSPLLESWVAVASEPMVSPPSPTRLATRAASSSTVCLVAVPLLM